MQSLSPRKESQAVTAAMVAAAAMMAQLIAGKAVRDALFLSTFGVRALPGAMIVSAVVALSTVLGAAALYARWSPARVVPIAFLTSAGLFVAEWFGFAHAPTIAATGLYLHVVAVGAVLSSGFWSVFNERFDPHTAKSYVARVTIGGSVGGLVGGLVGWKLASMLSVPVVLLLLAALNVVSAASLLMTGRPRPASVAPSHGALPQGSAPSNPGLSSYLRDLGALVLVGAAVQAILDYGLGVQASQMFEKGPRLMGFFSAFYVATGAISLLIQLAATKSLLSRLGIGGALAVLPGGVFAASLVSLFLPGIGGAIAARGAEAVLRNSTYRSAYELLYTPIPTTRKRSAKTLIDVGCDRLGSAAGSAIVMGIIAWAGAWASGALTLLVLVASAGCLYLSARLRNGYVETLAEGLHSGVTKLDVSEAHDATTMHTLSATSQTLDRQALLKEIERLRKQGLIGDTKKPRAAQSSPEPTPVSRAINELASGDPLRVRAVLERSEPWSYQLVPHLIPLLANDRVARQAVHFLRQFADRAVGMLVDALVDPAQPHAVRRRIPRVLKAASSQRALDGLWEGMKDESFDVRLRCALAIYAVTENNRDLVVRPQEVFDAVQDQLRAWRGHAESAAQEDEKESAIATALIEHGRDDGIRVALLLLATVLEREPLVLATKALNTEDQTLRGTALEYLDNVLPPDVRAAIFSYLEMSIPSQRRPCDYQRAVDTLIRSKAAIEGHLAVLKERRSGIPT